MIGQAIVDLPPRCVDYPALDALVMRHLPGELAPLYRQAARHRLLASLGAYLRLFDLRRRWMPLGVELFPDRRRRIDVVWHDRRGRVLFDEIKTGRRVRSLGRPGLLAQVGDQLADGQSAFGARFVGVRVVYLTYPFAEEWVTPTSLTRTL